MAQRFSAAFAIAQGCHSEEREPSLLGKRDEEPASGILLHAGSVMLSPQGCHWKTWNAWALTQEFACQANIGYSI
ncbi:MAG TPA: hypothetical protein VJP83_10295 [Terriglobales bacterium]|nr:hypothetical protein [Terriglobales bacterium]